jgi:hypothetical protein
VDRVVRRVRFRRLGSQEEPTAQGDGEQDEGDDQGSGYGRSFLLRRPGDRSPG